MARRVKQRECGRGHRDVQGVQDVPKVVDVGVKPGSGRTPRSVAHCADEGPDADVDANICNTNASNTIVIISNITPTRLLLMGSSCSDEPKTLSSSVNPEPHDLTLKLNRLQRGFEHQDIDSTT